jgi:hypothetical protein
MKFTAAVLFAIATVTLLYRFWETNDGTASEPR